MPLDPAPHSPEYVTLKEYFERLMDERQKATETALNLARENSRIEAQRTMVVIGIVVSVANIGLTLLLKKP